MEEIVNLVANNSLGVMSFVALIIYYINLKKQVIKTCFI